MDKAENTLDEAIDETNESNFFLTVEAETSGSLMRLRYLAASMPKVRRLRRELWGTSEPLFPSDGDRESLIEALKQIWTWVQDSPEDKRIERILVYEVGADSVETLVNEERKIKMPALLKSWENGGFVSRQLPFTHRAYELSNAARNLGRGMARGNRTTWWREEGAAVFLTTGVFERSALPRWVVATAGLQAVGSKSLAHARIEINDIGSVSTTEVANVYARTRQGLAEFESEHEFKVNMGRTEEYASEILAQLEMELILARANERYVRGESVRPDQWDYRPKPKELAEAWHRKAASFGLESDKAPSRQSISNFQSRVGRDLYIPALSDMWNEDDKIQASEEAERNHRLAIEAFKRRPKKTSKS